MVLTGKFGGLPDRPSGFQLVLWDTNAKINGLVATDLETLVSEVLHPFPNNAGFADGLFVMTTATDHKNNLNRSVLKKAYARTLRVETIANSAGGTAQVSIVAQPSIGFLNTKYYSNCSPTEDTEDCLGCRTHPVQIINPAYLPARHDGAHGHGTGDCDHCIWHPGPPKREKQHGGGLTLILIQPRESRTAKPVVVEYSASMGILSPGNRQPISRPASERRPSRK